LNFWFEKEPSGNPDRRQGKGDKILFLKATTARARVAKWCFLKLPPRGHGWQNVFLSYHRQGMGGNFFLKSYHRQSKTGKMFPDPCPYSETCCNLLSRTFIVTN
jgi:hypothetical protein